jgi:hypothetical protein
MTDSDAIDNLGGTCAVAELCNVRPPSVSAWRKAGIPAARRQFLELLRPDAFKPVKRANGNRVRRFTTDSSNS